MNRYRTALMNEKRKANANVVRMVFRSEAVARIAVKLWGLRLREWNRDNNCSVAYT
jgi:hypothetical protein